MRTLAVTHQDQVTSVAFDFYGRRLATCSADHTVKVFDRIGDKWQLNDSWRAHEAAVVKVTWAGPLHAPLLASGSHDCTVKLWDEVPEEPLGSGRRWRRRHTISDFKGPLYDVKFCPGTTSLKLAAIASDGVLRVYEAIDANNLGYWTAMVEIPLLNRPVSRQLQSAFALSWSPSPAHQDWIAVSVLDDALVFRSGSSGKYTKAAVLAGHGGLIRDIAWAPSFGRSDSLIATACKDGKLRIFSLQAAPATRGEKPKTGAAAVQGFRPETPPVLADESDALAVRLVHESADHAGEVWRVEWNSAGTILASTGDDVCVRFWKKVGTFKFMAVVDGSSKSFKAPA